MLDADIAQFVELTGTDDAQARRFLGGTDLQTAIANYYTAQESTVAENGDDHGAMAHDDDDDEEHDEQHHMIPSTSTPASGTATPSSTGYTLDGRPAPAMPAGWGGSGGAPRVGRVGDLAGAGSGGGGKKKSFGSSSSNRIKTFGSLQDPEDDDDSEDEDEKRKRQLYAGGGKSGLAIEDPPNGGPEPDENDVVAQILKQAREDTRQAQQGGNPSAGPSRGGAPAARGGAGAAFFGGGNTLGSDETPSVSVPDPSARPAAAPSGPPAGETRAQAMRRALQAMMGGAGVGPGQRGDEEDLTDEEDEGETAIRHLTFWKDGFSIEDGPLMRYDEPGNKEILEAIKSGRAPLSLLKVKFGQPVEVRVAQRSTEAYRPPPPRPMQAFEGSGNRLGSPAPDILNNTSATTAMPGGFGAAAGTIAAASSGTVPTPATSVFEVDPSKPTTSIQVRLADGTKIVAKMNLDHTIGDIRGFVRAAQPESRPFTIQTTFPNKVLEDDSQTIANAKLQNAVVVQRWS